jgi:hypothetical protein
MMGGGKMENKLPDLLLVCHLLGCSAVGNMKNLSRPPIFIHSIV